MGCYTTESPIKISITELRRQGYLRPGELVRGLYYFDEGKHISVETDLTPECYDRYGGPWVGVKYGIMSRGIPTQLDYRIELIKLPSNLGRGEILYFVCSITGRPCRILYAIPPLVFMSIRGLRSLGVRIYYPIQTYGKRKRKVQRAMILEDKLDELYSQRTTGTYKGRATRRAERIRRIEERTLIAQEEAMGALYSLLGKHSKH